MDDTRQRTVVKERRSGSVSGRIVERWVINFRMRPDDAAALVPVPWLRPLPVEGDVIWSYCPYVIADLHYGAVPLRRAPMVFAAGRLSVVDVNDPKGATVAWVPGRVGAHRSVGPVARTLLRLPFGSVDVSLSTPPGVRRLAIGGRRGDAVFAATLDDTDLDEHVGGPDANTKFATTSAFETFFACTTSWAPGTCSRSVARLELDAHGTAWRRVTASAVSGSAVPRAAVLDSAFHGTGGTYRWVRREQVAV